jgi:addiction module HigA family antidote
MATGFSLEWRAVKRCPDIGLPQIEVKEMDKQPKNPFHPGEMLLEEFLEPQGMSQAEFARRIGWTKARLNELIRGKRGVTAGAALDLADALGTSAKLWMNLQGTYDLDKASAARKAA